MRFTLVVAVDGLLFHEEDFSDINHALDVAYSDRFRAQFTEWSNVECSLFILDAAEGARRYPLWETPFDPRRWLGRQRTIHERLHAKEKKK